MRNIIILFLLICVSCAPQVERNTTETTSSFVRVEDNIERTSSLVRTEDDIVKARYRFEHDSGGEVYITEIELDGCRFYHTNYRHHDVGVMIRKPNCDCDKEKSTTNQHRY